MTDNKNAQELADAERLKIFMKEIEEIRERQSKFPRDMGVQPLNDRICEGAIIKAPWLGNYWSFRNLSTNRTAPRQEFLRYLSEQGVDASERIDRSRGALLGLALGDVLGVPLEFSRRDVKTVSGIEGGGPFKLKAGYWTDDTSMAFCLAYSLIARKGFDPAHQMECYSYWYRYGAFSSTHTCFDIGNATRAALELYLRTGQAYAGSDDPRSAGNGSLMRLAPIPIFYFDSFEQTVHYAALSSQTTHRAVEAIDACRYYAALIYGALHGVSKEELLNGIYSPLAGYWQAHPLHPNIANVALGSYKHKTRAQISSSGYVVHTLEAALWAFFHHDNFRDGVLAAVNLADDSDTVGAVYGQLAGAFFGETALPIEWVLHTYAAQSPYHFAQDLLEAAKEMRHY